MEAAVSTPKSKRPTDARTSPTAPQTNPLSANVWQFLENDVPGFNYAMKQGTAQMKAGKATRLKDGRTASLGRG